MRDGWTQSRALSLLRSASHFARRLFLFFCLFLVPAKEEPVEVEAEAEGESESDDEDMPELEEADKDASGAQVNRSEKKARKAILKLGLKQVPHNTPRSCWRSRPGSLYWCLSSPACLMLTPPFFSVVPLFCRCRASPA